jgi:hypothetical protein
VRCRLAVFEAVGMIYIKKAAEQIRAVLSEEKGMSAH